MTVTTGANHGAPGGPAEHPIFLDPDVLGQIFQHRIAVQGRNVFRLRFAVSLYIYILDTCIYI